MLFISSSATTKLKPIIDKYTSQREKNLQKIIKLQRKRQKE